VMFKLLVIFVVLAVLHSELVDAANQKNNKNDKNVSKNVAHHAVKHAPAKKAHNAKQKKSAPKKVQTSLRLKMKPTNRATTQCEDKAENCDEFVSWCKEPSYSAILKKYCQKGCGYCAPVGENCVDAFADKCRAWAKKGFCRAKFLDTTQKRAMCAKSCDLCGDSKGGEKACDDKDKKYTKDCFETSCAKEKGDKQGAECKKWCAEDANKSKDACKPASECATKEKKYEKTCLEETCNTDEEKKTPSKDCEAYCKDDATKDKCKKTDCTAKDKKYKKTCLEETCNTDEEKKTPSKDCEAYCKDDATKDKCKTSAADPKCDGANKYKDENDCAEKTCADDKEKDTKDCVDYCSDDARGGKKKVCSCDEDGNKYKDWCGQKTCLPKDAKKEEGCNTHCSKTDFKDKDSCKCSADDNKYQKWCLEETCNKDPDKTTKGEECKKYCADNAGKCK